MERGTHARSRRTSSHHCHIPHLFFVWCTCICFAIITSSNTDIVHAMSTDLPTDLPTSKAERQDTTMDISEDTVAKLNQTILDGNFFVYLNLEFPNIFGDFDSYFSANSTIIDPSIWVYAAHGKGNIILALPFDFIPLSLGSLKLGVDTIDVPINNATVDDFDGRTDEEIIQDVAGVLYDLVFAASTENDAFSICLERQLRKDELDKTMSIFLPGASYTIMQTSTVYSCWTDAGGVISSSYVELRKYQTLITGIYILGVILALYSPLAGSFLIELCPTPPANKTKKEVIAINSDLPLGFKYTLLFWGNKCKWTRLIRWVFFVTMFGVIPYVPYMTWAAIGQCTVRFNAINNAGVMSYFKFIGWHVFIELSYFVSTMLLLCFTFDNYNLVTTCLKVDEPDRKKFCLINLPKGLHIPKAVELENSSEERRAHGFFTAMRYRSLGLINPELYRYFFGTPLFYIQQHLLGRLCDPSLVVNITSILIYLFIFPFLVVIFVFMLLFYALPIGDCLHWILRKTVKEKFEITNFLVAIGIGLLSVSIFFKFLAVFIYISELIGYTFLAFVVHTNDVGTYLLMATLFLGIIIHSATDFYDGYCRLLLRLVTMANAVDNGRSVEDSAGIDPASHAESAPSEPTIPITKSAAATADTEPQSPPGSPNCTTNIEMKLIPKAPTPDTGNLVLCNDHGVPFIRTDLFWSVVKKYRPMKVQLVGIFGLLFVLGVVVLLGLSIIKTIDGLSELPDTVEFFATVVVAGVIPVLVLIVQSPGKTECLDESKWRQLDADLCNYANDGKFKVDILQ